MKNSTSRLGSNQIENVKRKQTIEQAKPELPLPNLKKKY